MSENNKKDLVPELRFPEFVNENEWKISNLGAHCTITTGKLDANAMTANGRYRFYTCAKNHYKIDNYAFDTEALLVSGNGANVGYIHYYKGQFNAYQRTYVLDQFNVNIIFVKYSLEQNLHRRIATEKKDGNTPYIVMSTLTEMDLHFPRIKEQQKIASCLSSLDEVIAAHTQKYERFQLYKKGLLQKLFPVEAETVPELRFPEFEESHEWEIKQMKKLFKIGNGKDHKHLTAGNIPVYGSGGYMRSVSEYLYDGESACIGRKGTIDNPIFLSGKFWTVDTLFYTHSFNGCLPKFIYLIFQNIDWRSHNEAGGVPSLSKANIEKIEIALPKLNEQQKIVDFLFSLDDIITVQFQKIEELKAHKKGLMQQLFPTVDEAIA